MRTITPLLVALLCASASSLQAAIITLGTENSGYYWYERQSWTGGSNTASGFAYGDATGLLYVQRNYQYYGGADRYWETKDAFFQIDLSSIDGATLTAASLNFYVTANTTAESFLRHLDTQPLAATGDVAQRLAGNADVASTTSFVLGWNSIDITGFIAADLAKGYDYAAFSIPMFAQSQDENRLLSLFGAGTTETRDGISVRPYVQVTAIPEPSTYALGIGGLALGFAIWRRRRR